MDQNKRNQFDSKTNEDIQWKFSKRQRLLNLLKNPTLVIDKAKYKEDYLYRHLIKQLLLQQFIRYDQEENFTKQEEEESSFY